MSVSIADKLVELEKHRTELCLQLLDAVNAHLSAVEKDSISLSLHNQFIANVKRKRGYLVLCNEILGFLPDKVTN